MKNIFLFGAGASHGSGGLNYLTPLGSQLFFDLKKHFSNTWGSLPKDVLKKLEENFEEGMEIVWKEHSNNVGVLMQDMAVFFSKIIISNPSENLYVSLVKELKEKNILPDSVISTLNYDCLLELATIPNQISIAYSLPFGEVKDSLLVWKLHGSCNFILDGIVAKRGVNYMSGAFFNGNGLKSIQISDVEQYCRGDNALYPAMSIFMKDKPNQIGKPHIEAMQNKWKEWILNAEKIFLIGVNPDMKDSHVWDSLSKTKSKIFFCGNKDSFEKWQKIKSRNDIYLGARFKECYLDIIKNL